MNQPEAKNLRCLVSVLDSRSQSMLAFRPHLLQTVSELKRMCQNSTAIPASCQEILCRGKVISDRRMLADLVDFALPDSASSEGDSSEDPGRPRFAERGRLPPNRRPSFRGTPEQFKLELVLRIKRSKSRQFGEIAPMHKLSSRSSKNIVKKITQGMNRRLNPAAIAEGFSGSYYLLDEQRGRVAIFKPRLEEAFAPLNPKGFKSKLGTEIHSSGIFSGEQYLREAAAFLMDEQGLFDVPETFLASVKHEYFKNSHERRDIMRISHYLPETLTQKDAVEETLHEEPSDQFHKMNCRVNSHSTRIGSVQKMVHNSGTISEVPVNKLSAFEVQKIALLDMRLLNADRNEGNLLYRKTKNGIQLIPIDHGMCLGRALGISQAEVVWTTYPQIHLPLDPRLVKYMRELKPKETVQRLAKKLDLPKSVLDLVRISETFLKMCVKRKMTIYEMAQLFYRENEEKSALEKIVESVEFMSRGSKVRDEWYLENQILAKTRRVTKKTLDQRVSKLKRKIKKNNIKNEEKNIFFFMNLSEDQDNVILYNRENSKKKINFDEKKMGLPLNAQLNKNFEITPFWKDSHEQSLASPMTFLSKKLSKQKETLHKIPLFIENDQMKSKNTLSTEHPICPFIKNQNQLKLISFSSLEGMEEPPKNKSQTYLDPVIKTPICYARRRINSEVIKTSVEKTKNNVKKSFFCETLDNQIIGIDNLKKMDLTGKDKESRFSREHAEGKRSPRSLSVFMIPKEKGKNDSLGDFRQKSRWGMIRSFNDSGQTNPFELGSAESLPRKNLKIHFAKCCLEQLLEGWASRRTIHSAKRKNTAPIFK